MRIDTLFNILKCLDFFGISFNFYTEGNQKLYFGEILSLFSIVIGIIIYISINLDDFLHNSPISTISIERENHHNTTFKKEKIWIPWRLRNFSEETINHPIYYTRWYIIIIELKIKAQKDLIYNINL